MEGAEEKRLTADEVLAMPESEQAEAEKLLSKKEKSKLEKKRKKAAAKADGAAKSGNDGAAVSESKQPFFVEDWDKEQYGDIKLSSIQSIKEPSENDRPRQWTDVQQLNDDVRGSDVWIRARVHIVRKKGKSCFWVLRQGGATVQALMFAGVNDIPKDMVDYCGAVNRESVVDIFGRAVEPAEPILSCTQQRVEIQIFKAFIVNRSRLDLAFQVEDVCRGIGEEEVGQDVRLNNRILDLRSIQNHAIFSLQSAIVSHFRMHLLTRGFIEIHSPKLIGAASESGASVFEVKYFGGTAYLAQSPQLYKQMMVQADYDKVFEVGPIFRAENSLTHRHMTEFTGLDMEMTVKESVWEVIHELDALFLSIFQHLKTDATCTAAVAALPGLTPFVVPTKVPHLIYSPEVVDLINAHLEEGVEPLVFGEDLGTSHEKAMGRMVRESAAYEHSDFFALVGFPSEVRPFYSMSSSESENTSLSYDYYMRGEEILSGALRVHDCDMLRTNMLKKGVDPATMQSYIDAFSMGGIPHGGGGIGLERVLMLYLGLSNIRRTSLFPRDPKRCQP